MPFPKSTGCFYFFLILLPLLEVSALWGLVPLTCLLGHEGGQQSVATEGLRIGLLFEDIEPQCPPATCRPRWPPPTVAGPRPIQVEHHTGEPFTPTSARVAPSF